MLPLPAGWEALLMGGFKFLSFLIGMMFTSIGAFVIQNVYFSRNPGYPPAPLSLESWPLTDDQMHNANVDLIWYREAFYLVHAVSPFHFGTPQALLIIKCSRDGQQWQQVATIRHGTEDLRDPKFALIDGKLFLYVFLNRETRPLPYTTRVTFSDDGKHWSSLTPIGHEGWLFWRPKTLDGQTWYVPAYWHKFHHNALFATTDGLHFTQVATISTRPFINEPEIEFLPDGTLLATGRGDNFKGAFQQLIGVPESSTLLSTAAPPYTEWQERVESHITRLDGPVMFRHRGRVFAVGRAHCGTERVFPRRGAVLAKKRTALYEVRPEGLTYLLALPSCGDTSYAGVVVKDGFAYIAYYTNNPRKDYLWLFGMIEPSEIRMAKIPLSQLEQMGELGVNSLPVKRC